MPVPKDEKNEVARREEEILAFWKKNNIFKRSEDKNAPKGEYVFYDGPPFATGLPHYGHILAGTIKDAIPRYQTMRGYRVRRRWGWDCHGLPLENQIEEELGLKTKKDIEEIGVAKFNAAARKAVLRYVDDWKEIVPRMGRWVDMEQDYKTMDASYMESVWWIFKELHNKKLIYEGFKSMHLCPRCGTTLSNFEVALGYKDITDFAVTVKLELKDEPGTFLLAWTTTPWTLPGNMAAAVHQSETYVKVQIENEKFILAKNRLEILNTDDHEILEEYKGEQLVGKKYKPLFNYFVNTGLKGKENAWKIYHAPYVSTEEGTGAVHLAPAFGAEDMELAKENGIPLVHHVGEDGKFIEEVTDFAGLSVKPKENHQSADIEIIKHLAHSGSLFKKEKITHSYPHCWRCDTPLLNYAACSWFVEVTKIKDKLVAVNKKVHWVPGDIRDGRFGKWLEGARDWAISRSRYWGAPLPVWKNEKTGNPVVIGSVSELKSYTKRSGNTYFIMRHGESELNTKGILNSDLSIKNPLTERGRKRAQEAAKKYKGEKLDFIFHSPLERTTETAIIVANELEVPKENVIADERLVEVGFGEFEGKTIEGYHSFFSYSYELLTKSPKDGETWVEIKKRTTDFLYELEEKYQGKKFLIVSHNGTMQMLQAGAYGLDFDTCAQHIADDLLDLKNAEVRKIPFVPLPHNTDYELDLHRPYIDSVTLIDHDGEALVRVPDVFDCWFESGSMPYGQTHYPFEGLDEFEPKKKIGYPADFIAEGLDQTRGWFYSLIVLGTALFGESPYKNVIVNGLVLAEDGRKMSKKLKNYPDPLDVAATYGADSLRYYLLSSSIMKGEDLHFSEKNVAEIMRKNIGRLSNVLSFHLLYKGSGKINELKNKEHILDVWIYARLHELIHEVTEGMEHYELDKATRPIASFIDDLSAWYLRRSRDRFKSDDAGEREQALETMQYVLQTLSKVIAPFMPFFAEYLYRSVTGACGSESVHLTDWPTAEKINTNILEEMKVVRAIVSMALEMRDKAGIKVRQPLSELRIKNKAVKGKKELLELIQDEVNVKEVVHDESLGEDIKLDTALTPLLKEEGNIRDFIRQAQDVRKKNNFHPQDKAIMTIETDEQGEVLLKKYEIQLKRAISLEKMHYKPIAEGETQVRIGNMTFRITITK